jgi:uncharacterized protein YoaH (UPF0181 family)
MTDEEYLTYVCNRFNDMDSMFAMLTADHVEERIEQLVAAGLLVGEEIEVMRRKLKEISSPAEMMSGEFIGEIRDMALGVLGSEYEYLRKIPVGLAATKEFNAFAAPSPSGGHVIV